MGTMNWRHMGQRGSILWIMAMLTLIACGYQSVSGQARARALPYRWVYLSANLLPDENLPPVEALMRRAAKDGYTGIVLADYKFNLLDRMDDRYFQHVETIKALAKSLKLELIPCV